MRHLTLGEVVELHRRLLLASGGAAGIRDIGLLESALAQPGATFDGTDLHPTLVDKAAALGFSLWRITLSSMGTSGLATLRWKSFWY